MGGEKKERGGARTEVSCRYIGLDAFPSVSLF